MVGKEPVSVRKLTKEEKQKQKELREREKEASSTNSEVEYKDINLHLSDRGGRSLQGIQRGI